MVMFNLYIHEKKNLTKINIPKHKILYYYYY